MIYLQLFWAFFQIGLLSFGGGYAALPLISQQVISTYHWISQNTFTDLITISQMTPGPIAVNSSTFVGQYVAHLPGALIATLGCILPSCVIVSLLAYVSTGKLTFVNDTDLIAGDHAAFTFQGGIGNIKYIGGTVRVQNKLAS